MIEQLQEIIQVRVREVLQLHLNGTPEEFNAASKAVMNELSSMGGSAQSLVDITSADVTTDDGRKELAEQLIQFMRKN
tara:strand:+ start:487 stop:720 length:234 start_codon:yes stop_codon:yes gene_type:complete